MRRPEEHQPLYVPDAFDAEFGELARRMVARSRHPAGRGRIGMSRERWEPRPARGRWFRVLAVLHALAGIVIVAFATVTGTWLEAAVLLASTALAFAGSVVVVRVVVIVDRRRRRAPRWRPEPAVSAPDGL